MGVMAATVGSLFEFDFVREEGMSFIGREFAARGERC